jgi:DNA-directed RNA polymerase III subunit RPC6
MQIDEQEADDEPVFLQVAMAMPDSSVLNQIPCGQCPVMNQCEDGGHISPATCPYMDAWLQF